MEELKREYTLLFNGITDAIATLEDLTQRFMLLQQAAENLYLESAERAQELSKRENKESLEPVAANMAE